MSKRVLKHMPRAVKRCDPPPSLFYSCFSCYINTATKSAVQRNKIDNISNHIFNCIGYT